MLTNYFLGYKSSIFLDAPGWKHPPQIGEFKPDLYAQHPLSGLLIIGEAETEKSMSNLHAEHQIATFIERCAREDAAIFILAVPWHTKTYAKAVLRRILCTLDGTTQVAVIDELGS